MEECVEVMEAALRTLARGGGTQPLRSVVRCDGVPGVLGLMPAQLDDPPVLGAKVITVFPGNTATPFDSHQGVVLLHEPKHGRLLAVLDAGKITAVRTAAVSAVATRALAREDAGDLAILGTGVQADTHLEAMRCVRELRRVRVHGRSPERARAFADRARDRLGIEIEIAATPAEAVRGTDIVCTVTSSAEPVLRGADLAPGVHVNAVGACVPAMRELDAAAVARSRIFVDRLESAMNESGDLLLALEEGAIAETPVVAELGDVLLGEAEGRTGDDDVTLFESLGIGIEDLAAAHHVYERARREGRGVAVQLDGGRP